MFETNFFENYHYNYVVFFPPILYFKAISD